MTELRETVAKAIAESDRNKDSGIRMADLWGNEAYRRTVTKHADAALAAIKQAATVDRVEAALKAIDHEHDELYHLDDMLVFFCAMIDVANSPPAKQ